MTPITRLEKFLNGIVYGGTVPEPPITRIETMLNDIKNGDVVSLTPITREETFLAKISGANVEIPTPITRIEMFLAKICGVEIATPSPIVRIEHWLNEWASGEDPLGTFTGAIARFFSRASKPIVKVEANFTPIQNLNGQEAPYPPGGGKNKFSFANISSKNIYRANVQQMGTDPNAFYLAGATGTSDTMQLGVAPWAYVCIWIGYQTTEETTITVSCKVRNYSADCNGYIRIRYGDTQNRSGSTAAETTYFNNVGEYQVAVTATIPSGKYVGLEFTPASKADNFTLTQYTEVTEYQLEIGSTPTAFAPYSNICPISGHTGCDAVRTGKNLIDQDDSDYLNVEARAYGYSDSKIVAQLNKLKAGTYTLSLKAKVTSFNGEAAATTNLGLYFRAVNNGTNFNVVGTISGIPVIGEEKSKTVTFTLTDDYVGKFTSCFVYTGQSSTIPRVLYSSIIYDVQLELGSTASAYEAFSGTTVSISFGTTVYGGKLTVFDDGSGQIEADRAKVTIDGEKTLGNFAASANTSRAYLRASYFSPVMKPNNTTTNTIMCEELKCYAPDYIVSNDVEGVSENRNLNDNGIWLRILNSRLTATTLNGMKAWLTDNPINVVYFIKEPFTIPVTAQQIQTLVGENNVWVNAATGDITVQAYGTAIT